MMSTVSVEALNYSAGLNKKAYYVEKIHGRVSEKRI